MTIPPLPVPLKNGGFALLRIPAPQDAAAVLAHRRCTSSQTDFMARTPEEIDVDPAQQADHLAALLCHPRQVELATFVDGQLVAAGGVAPVSPLQKYRHRAAFGISVQQRYWGLGLGSIMLARLLAAARSMGYTQLELEVDARNTRGLALYQKFGFSVYGTRPATTCYHGAAVPALLMARPL